MSLQITSLCWQARGQNVLQNITASVNTGDCLAVIGPNGAGKSSLMRCLMGWVQPSQGSVTLQGKPVHTLRSRDRAQRLAWLPQRPEFAESLPVIDVVANARFRFSESRNRSHEMAEKALETFHVQQHASKLWHTLSGGEAQRVNLASLWAQQADIWLLDEPANHLDPAVQQTLYLQLVGQWLEGQTTVIITHNLNLLLATVPEANQSQVQVLGLKEGRQAFSSALNDPSLPRQLGEIYEVNVEEITAFGKRQWVFGVRQ